MYKELETTFLLDINETIANKIFKDILYPWEALSKISDFIIELGNELPADEFDKVGDNIWIAKSAKVAKSAHIDGPCIIDKDAEIRHCAFIRGKVIIGKGAVIGNSVELKNAIVFNMAQIPHYNYIGDSIIGYKSHLGAQALTSNVKSDKTLTTVNFNGNKIQTGLKKFGAIVGDNVEIGCSTVLNPATVIGKNTNIYPLSFVRGYVPSNSILKKDGKFYKKNEEHFNNN